MALIYVEDSQLEEFREVLEMEKTRISELLSTMDRSGPHWESVSRRASFVFDTLQRVNGALWKIKSTY